MDRSEEATIRAHAEHMESDEFQAQVRRIERLTRGLVSLVWLSHMQTSRMPVGVDTLLMFAATDDTLESVVAIQGLVRQGTLNVARRECRYLLEQAVKHLYVDQKNPSLEVTREQRHDFLKKEVPRSSIEPVNQVSVLVPVDEQDAFRQQVKVSGRSCRAMSILLESNSRSARLEQGEGNSQVRDRS